MAKYRNLTSDIYRLTILEAEIRASKSGKICVNLKADLENPYSGRKRRNQFIKLTRWGDPEWSSSSPAYMNNPIALLTVLEHLTDLKEEYDSLKDFFDDVTAAINRCKRESFYAYVMSETFNGYESKEIPLKDKALISARLSSLEKLCEEFEIEFDNDGKKSSSVSGGEQKEGRTKIKIPRPASIEGDNADTVGSKESDNDVIPDDINIPGPVDEEDDLPF